MKQLFRTLTLPLLIAGFIFCSCKKERSCEDCQTNQSTPPTSNTNRSPNAVAGPDQTITLPTTGILLNGSASNDPDGRITAFLWEKISGPASSNISNASAVQTPAGNLTIGEYLFELKVTDNGGLSAKDTVKVTVKTSANHPPFANAGNDTTITLPANAVNLDGSKSTDADNNIISYAWAKISGPASFNIVNANSLQAQATNLAEGVYQFELTVTDLLGLFDKDTTTVTVLNSFTNEIIFSNQYWQCWWGCWIEIPNLYSHVPAGIPFQVFIKRDNGNNWEEAIYGSQSSNYGFLVDSTSLVVYMGMTANGDNDTPDIKIVY